LSIFLKKIRRLRHDKFRNYSILLENLCDILDVRSQEYSTKNSRLSLVNGSTKDKKTPAQEKNCHLLSLPLAHLAVDDDLLR